MSRWDDILDHVESEWRAAVPGIPSDQYGISREARISHENLPDSQMPHVSLGDLAEAAEPLTAETGPSAYQQFTVAYALRMDFWTRGLTSDQHREHVEDFFARIDADRSLGGHVDLAWRASLETTSTENAGRYERRTAIELAMEFVE